MEYGLDGKTAIITGAGGVICGEIARALARHGIRVAIWDISLDAAEMRAGEIRDAGGDALAVKCDATDTASVQAATAVVMAEYGDVDILINGAGGSRKECTTSPDLEFFDIDIECLKDTVALNYISAVVPCQAVGRVFARKRSGVIVNISSISAVCPLTRAIAYSNSKAALNNFTQWLAVHMAHEYAPEIRVNAIAPGFLLTEQNRFLLLDEHTGEMTERGKQIITHVPMRRYGRPEEIAGAALWLVSDSASFVTGAVIAVDGGFTAFSGV